MRTGIARVAAALAAVICLALATFAIPVRVWRTGELPAPPLPLVEGGPAVAMPRRIWIDTDAACGHSDTTDPDDCLALLLLARAEDVEIAGVSAVQGNAPLEVTERTTQELAGMLGMRKAGPQDLREALAQGPLTIVALGPLTNIAAALAGRPALRRNVARLVVVMGRTPGHLFHPGEGAGRGMLFGHGPVFRDFNFDKDRDAAARVLAMRLPVTLVPYAAARQVSLTGDARARAFRLRRRHRARHRGPEALGRDLRSRGAARGHRRRGRERGGVRAGALLPAGRFAAARLADVEDLVSDHHFGGVRAGVKLDADQRLARHVR